jgi:hypothetical protein
VPRRNSVSVQQAPTVPEHFTQHSTRISLDFVNVPTPSKIVFAVDSLRPEELGPFEFEPVDTDNKLTEQERLKMCADALKQQRLEDRGIELLEDEGTEPRKSYSLKLHAQQEEGETRIVPAFKCPTQPSVYLQVHIWELEVYMARVIVRKSESSEQSIPERITRKVGQYDFKIKYVQAISEGMLLYK